MLPVLLLAYYSLASITRLTRSACLSEMNKEYILLARAKGAGEMTILLRHVLPNIRGTLLTVIALAYTSMLEGAVLTETVFSAGDRALPHNRPFRRRYHRRHGRHAADWRLLCTH